MDLSMMNCRRSWLLSLLVVACFLFSSKAQSQTSDRQVLELFFVTCNGNFWSDLTDWLDPNISICDWFGVDCVDTGEETIERLILPGNNVACALPKELFLLGELKWLDLRLNSGVAFDFMLLDRHTIAPLENLILSDTNVDSLQGIDAFAATLTTFYVSGCSLAGPFPPDVLRLTALKNLDLSYNLLSGEIPEAFGDLTDLRSCGLNHNFFIGQIPSTIGNLNRLTNFQLQFNQLSGALPSALGELFSLSYLTLNDQSDNGGISGPLVDFANLQFLYHIDLSNNALSGNIPPTLLASLMDVFGSMIYVDLRSNKLTGSIPDSLSRFQSIKIYFANNAIESVPAVLCEQTDWLFGQVGQYGCDGLLCPPGTYNSFGRQVSDGFPCLECANAPYYGGESCEASPFVSPSNLLNINATYTVESSSDSSLKPRAELTPDSTSNDYEGRLWQHRHSSESSAGSQEVKYQLRKESSSGCGAVMASLALGMLLLSTLSII